MLISEVRHDQIIQDAVTAQGRRNQAALSQTNRGSTANIPIQPQPTTSSVGAEPAGQRSRADVAKSYASSIKPAVTTPTAISSPAVAANPAQKTNAEWAKSAGFPSVAAWYGDLNRKLLSPDPKIAGQAAVDLRNYEKNKQQDRAELNQPKATPATSAPASSWVGQNTDKPAILRKQQAQGQTTTPPTTNPVADKTQSEINALRKVGDADKKQALSKQAASLAQREKNIRGQGYVNPAGKARQNYKAWSRDQRLQAQGYQRQGQAGLAGPGATVSAQKQVTREIDADIDDLIRTLRKADAVAAPAYVKYIRDRLDQTFGPAAQSPMKVVKGGAATGTEPVSIGGQKLNPKDPKDAELIARARAAGAVAEELVWSKHWDPTRRLLKGLAHDQ